MPAVHALSLNPARLTNPHPTCLQRNKQVRRRPVSWSHGRAITHQRCRGSGSVCAPCPPSRPRPRSPPSTWPPPQKQDVKPKVQNQGAASGPVGLCLVGTKQAGSVGEGGAAPPPSWKTAGAWCLARGKLRPGEVWVQSSIQSQSGQPWGLKGALFPGSRSCFYQESDKKQPLGGGRGRRANGGGGGRLKFLEELKRTNTGMRGVNPGLWGQGEPPGASEGTPRDREGSLCRRSPGLPWGARAGGTGARTRASGHDESDRPRWRAVPAAA